MAVQLRLVVDGQTVLDTAARGRPLAFIYGSRPSGGVTRGLEEGLATMSAGVCGCVGVGVGVWRELDQQHTEMWLGCLEWCLGV